jgi:DNA-damage-inducible protein J
MGYNRFMTAKTETIRARIIPGLKEDAEAIFSMLGLSTSDAITLFLKQVVMRKAIPFEVMIPNELTRKVIAEAKKGKGVRKTTLEALKREFVSA